MMSNDADLIHLSAAGVSLVLDCSGGRLPSVVHWGAALGSQSAEDLAALAEASVLPVVNNTPDQTVRLSLLPEAHTGWLGRPGLSGHRDGRYWSPRFVATSVVVHGRGARNDDRGTAMNGTGTAATSTTAAGGTVVVGAEDSAAGLALRIEIELLPSGVLRSRAAITNHRADVYEVDDLMIALPVPERAREVLDFAGRWGKERTPQRRQLGVGIHEREGRRGRTGPDAATVLSVGTPGFGFADGEVWGVHVAFSGNHRHIAERVASGVQVLGGGELLLPGEIRLQDGDSYSSPWIYGVYSVGLDEQAARFHRFLRARPQHPGTPRPVTINVWEAVYFDHDLARLTDLADRAARLGVERFVLDDGWFRHRRDDHAGLGDWYVDETVWPDGLAPLVDHVRSRGMQFGLWFEPEMINEDSDLARAHPDWIMQTEEGLPVPSRSQQVLDLARPEAFAYLEERMSSLIAEYRIDYIKWDHNRDLVDAGGRDGRAGVHAQTLACYRLMARLKERFPGLEIESCSSGGARVDLGIIEHTDRVWVSDCIDPVERQQMNRWTMQLLPPELLGSHIASGKSHTTGRWHELSFRAGTALFGHLGIEWDLAQATAAEERELAAWIALYQETRGLLHGGDLVRMDEADPTQFVYGTVAPDRREALFFFAVVGRSEVSPRGRLTFRGLDPALHYRVTPIVIGDAGDIGAPAWWNGGAGTLLSGGTLRHAGLQAPTTFPDRVVLFRLAAV